jgi:hypothetical protein
MHLCGCRFYTNDRRGKDLRALLRQEAQFPRPIREDFDAVVLDDDGIFDANASPPWKVDSRFDRDDHSGLQNCLGPRAYVRRLVNLQPYTVPQAVDEAIGQAASRKTISRH